MQKIRTIDHVYQDVQRFLPFDDRFKIILKLFVDAQTRSSKDQENGHER